ncbi:pentatricopeptide repeat-containing protein At4g02750-like [Selaginella moellendorffii]|uniref:pentatricopeptide repeat-containing protein At4g02750-like n=1 Tax=Selaginella moellendorffii TaxID=88036 RepID=UPI000D1CCD79|nr:pentatricopeptide repeat-containing protein At4g02750-like [Selaginella moellendorffii]|eukprot:XP_024538365.1 pentatricopeptide repeat-containing protein At4g02750-like [Selaginella moellendorffii]
MYGRCGAAQDARSAFDRIAQPTSYSWNLLLAAFAHNGHLLEAQTIYRAMPWPDTVSANIMIAAYGQNARLDLALDLFWKNRDRDLVSWNSMLAAFAKNDRGEEALELFRAMDLEGFQPNKVSFVSLLHACSSIRSLSLATIRMIQCLMAPYGYEIDVIPATALLNLFGRCGATAEAKRIFDRIPSPNAVSWTTMLVLFLRSGDLASAMELFDRMPWRSVVSWNAMISAMAGRDLAEPKKFFDAMPAYDSVSVNSMLAAYSHHPGEIDRMRELFDRMSWHRNTISWNTMIAGYAQAGNLHESLVLFKTMLLHGETVNQITLVAIIDACAAAPDLHEGRKLHALAAAELGFFTAIANVLIKLYTNCERLEYARNIFESLARPDVVSVTAMITAYGRMGCAHEAKRIFDATLEHDVITWTAIVGALAQNGHLDQAENLYGRMPLWDQMASNTMVVAYGQSGHLDQAKQLFVKMPKRNAVSCNALISAFTANGHPEDALKMLPLMDLEGQEPNKITFLAIIDAAAVNGAVAEALLVHTAVNESGLLQEHTELGTSLVNMYGRCGSVLTAHRAFNAILTKSYISWNAVVTAYAQNGHAEVAGDLTRAMELHGYVSNEVTFLSNLFACSHAGMIQEAWNLFVSMQSDYGITPQMDHYCCVVDLLGRSGTMEEAGDLIGSMPIEPSVVGWKTLLGASRVHSDVGQGLVASCKCVDESDSSVFALMSNVYTN